jgi:DUF2924 family protein
MALSQALMPAAKAAGSLAEQLKKLSETGLNELRIRFRRLYRTPAPPGLSRDLIARLVAHRLQEQHLGRLDPDLARQLDRLGRNQDAPRPPQDRDGAGARLCRHNA